MIVLCPHCGYWLPKAIIHGITGCSHCNRIFDSSPFNRLLSASWMVRRRNITCEENLTQLGFTQEEAELVVRLVSDECHSHQEFVRAIKELGISDRYQNPVDLAS